ncbi:hypothetical protein EJB05_35281, partial [Eragrostis curvula]
MESNWKVRKTGSPKKRTKKAKEASSSILPFDNDAPPMSMSFPPSQTIETIAETTTKKKRKRADSTPEPSNSQSLEITSKKKGQHNNSNSGGSKRSRSGSNQPDSTSGKAKQMDKPVKGKAKKVMSKKTKKKELCQEPRKLLLDSPSMCTRSKLKPASPAMRAKRSFQDTFNTVNTGN